MNLFQLRGEVTPRQRLFMEAGGYALLILLWYLLTMGAEPIVSPGILPKPSAVWNAFGELLRENDLIRNVLHSISLNLTGYLEAIAVALPLGFIIGLFPLFRGVFQRPVDSFRYIPLTAVTGLFILWFGLGVPMKVHFLAFGIFIYLLPVVVNRIQEVDDVYIKTIFTLGASPWQTIRHVFIPSVCSKLMDDIRVLTAISWTYIIIAESLGNEGGIGGLIWRAGQRQGRVDKVYALLIIIVIIGFIQDRIFTSLDRSLFPFKNAASTDSKNRSTSPFAAISKFGGNVISWAALAIYGVLLVNDFTGILGIHPVLREGFGPAVGIIHFLYFILLYFKVAPFLLKKKIQTSGA